MELRPRTEERERERERERESERERLNRSECVLDLIEFFSEREDLHLGSSVEVNGDVCLAYKAERQLDETPLASFSRGSNKFEPNNNLLLNVTTQLAAMIAPRIKIWDFLLTRLSLISLLSRAYTHTHTHTR